MNLLKKSKKASWWAMRPLRLFKVLYHGYIINVSLKIPSRHTIGQVFLCSLGFIKHRLEIQKVKSTANASKKIKTNHHGAFCTTH